MKKYFIICTMSFVLIQGCGTKTEKTEEVATPPEVTAVERLEIAELKRAKLEEQRSVALAELVAMNKYYEDTNGTMVYYEVEIEPAYVGGEAAMNQFLKDNLQFPEAAEDEELEGTVFVDFVVAENGEVTNVTATNFTYEDVNNLFRNEAMRVVSMMPDWTPGNQNGVPVHVKYSVPISFRIN